MAHLSKHLTGQKTSYLTTTYRCMKGSKGLRSIYSCWLAMAAHHSCCKLGERNIKENVAMTPSRRAAHCPLIRTTTLCAGSGVGSPFYSSKAHHAERVSPYARTPCASLWWTKLYKPNLLSCIDKTSAIPQKNRHINSLRFAK